MTRVSDYWDSACVLKESKFGWLRVALQRHLGRWPKRGSRRQLSIGAASFAGRLVHQSRDRIIQGTTYKSVRLRKVNVRNLSSRRKVRGAET